MGKPIAILDEYNHRFLPLDVSLCIQAKYPVPKHGPRIVEEEVLERPSENMDRCLIAFLIPRSKMRADEQRRRVYHTRGLCPTILTNSGGYFEVKILEGE